MLLGKYNFLSMELKVRVLELASAPPPQTQGILRQQWWPEKEVGRWRGGPLFYTRVGGEGQVGSRATTLGNCLHSGAVGLGGWQQGGCMGVLCKQPGLGAASGVGGGQGASVDRGSSEAGVFIAGTLALSQATPDPPLHPTTLSPSCS